MSDVVDDEGTPIKVGDTVLLPWLEKDGLIERAVIVAISDYDAEPMDDVAGGWRQYTPEVRVQFADGETDVYGTESTATGPWDEEAAKWKCGDVVKEPD